MDLGGLHGLQGQKVWGSWIQDLDPGSWILFPGLWILDPGTMSGTPSGTILVSYMAPSPAAPWLGTNQGDSYIFVAGWTPLWDLGYCMAQQAVTAYGRCIYIYLYIHLRSFGWQGRWTLYDMV